MYLYTSRLPDLLTIGPHHFSVQIDAYGRNSKRTERFGRLGHFLWM